MAIPKTEPAIGIKALGEPSAPMRSAITTTVSVTAIIEHPATALEIPAAAIIADGVKSGEFDHHGYGLAVATRKDFRCTLKRVETVRKRGSKRLPTGEFHYRVKRGQPSIL